ICPRCGREGSVIVKRIGDQGYVYVKHGKVWHYIGSLERVDLQSILIEHTTPLLLNGTQAKGASGGSMGRPLSKALALLLGIALMALGVVMATVVVAIMVIGAPYKVVIGADSVTKYVVNNTNAVYLFYSLTPANVTVSTIYASLKATIIPYSSLPTSLKAMLTHVLSRVPQANSVAFLQVNTTSIEALLPSFMGNYTTFKAVVPPNEALLIWPYKLYANKALLLYSYYSSGVAMRISLTRLALSIVVVLIVSGALIYGGIIVYKWSKR
ncbi:hypothetical protein, partial [Caldivirga sp.]|uniref:hypothetical protein n=1 Tax=Caldivirga sp. TaxID=2080243 RepID=UPI003D10FD75